MSVDSARRIINHRSLESLFPWGDRREPPPPRPVRTSNRAWTDMRHRLSAEQGGRCAYCGERNCVETIDHVTPIARGGTNAWSNLVMACERCNGAKGSEDAFDFFGRRGWLPREPIQVRDGVRPTLEMIWPA